MNQKKTQVWAEALARQQDFFRGSGLAVALSVGTLIERLDALVAGSAPLPADEMSAAMALLKRRGLDAPRMNEARELLSHIVTMDPAPTPDDSETRKAQLAQAEDALWAFLGRPHRRPLRRSDPRRSAVQRSSSEREASALVSRRRTSSRVLPLPLSPRASCWRACSMGRTMVLVVSR